MTSRLMTMISHSRLVIFRRLLNRASLGKASWSAKVVWLAFGCSLLFQVPALSFADQDIELLIDFSASMKARSGALTRVSAAKSAAAEIADALHPGDRLALRVYGHRIKSTERQASCHDSELILPFAKYTSRELLEALAGILPQGRTPLAFALDQVGGDFSGSGAQEKIVVLLSDGRETCGGDPAAVALGLIESGVKVVIHIVGIQLSGEAAVELQKVAQVTGGRFFNADRLETVAALTSGILGMSSAGGDLGTNQDAGADPAQALIVKPGRHAGRLGPNDLRDVFAFDARQGEKYLVRFSALDSTAGTVQVQVSQSKGESFLQENVPPGEDLGGAVFVPPADGRYLLVFALKSTGHSSSFHYQFELSKVVGY